MPWVSEVPMSCPPNSLINSPTPHPLNPPSHTQSYPCLENTGKGGRQLTTPIGGSGSLETKERDGKIPSPQLLAAQGFWSPLSPKFPWVTSSPRRKAGFCLFPTLRVRVPLRLTLLLTPRCAQLPQKEWGYSWGERRRERRKFELNTSSAMCVWPASPTPALKVRPPQGQMQTQK